MALSSRLKGMQKLLLHETSRMVAKYGFDRKVHGQSFRLSKPFGWAAFHLAFIPHAEIDFDVTADVALRVDAVEKMLHDSKEAATFGGELGNLSDGKQRRWTIASERDINPTVASIEKALVSIALPYIERYSNLEEMLAVLSRNDRDAWLHSPSHHYRGIRALALALVLGKQDRIQQLIEQSEAFMKSIDDPNLRFFQQFVGEMRSLPNTGIF